MKRLMQSSTAKGIAGVVLCAILFSFAPMPGAHNYQVFLDDKMMIEQYAHPSKEAPVLSIDPQGNAKELSVRYSECGRTVSGRHILLKDESGKVIKDWSFAGSTKGFENPMVVKVKEIVALKQSGSNVLKLYYSSEPFPEGQHVVTLRLSKETKTASR